MAQPSGDVGQENLRGRSGDLVAGRYLVTVGGPDGADIQPCPPEYRPAPRRRPTGGQRQVGRAAAGPGPTPAVGPLALGSGPGDLPLLDREAEVAQLLGKLAEGRSIRLLGEPGSGRSALLAAVVAGAGELAPHGVIQLCGHRRDADDLLQDLFAAAYQAPGFRPDRAQLPELLAGVGAIVVIDEIAQRGPELEELLARAPECAFVVAPAAGAAGVLPPDSRLEDHTIGGLTRPACLALTARLAGRLLDEAERAWAVDLWFESQGLPLRFVQAAALLRRRDLVVDTLLAAEEDRQRLFGGAPDGAPADQDPAVREAELRASVPLPTVAEAAAPTLLLIEGLSGAAEAVLRLAVALGGECPTAPHLPALIDVDHGESALRELAECGLAESIGGHHRLTAGVLKALAAHWGPDERSTQGAAQHFSWWVGHGSVSTAQIAAEAEVVLGALQADRTAGRTDAVLHLARAAAPALALTLRWGAWRQVLELGLGVARQSGHSREEAWFQHELGAYRLCLADGDPAAQAAARSALEAACGLRGAAGDSRQLAASRRLLTLLQEAEREPVEPEAETQAIRRPVIRVLAQRSWPPAGLLRGWSRRNALLAVGGFVALSAVGTAVALGVSGGGAAPTGGGTGVSGNMLNVGGSGGAVPTASAGGSGSAPGTASASGSASGSASPAASASVSVSPSASASKGRTATPTARPSSSATGSSAQPAPGQPGPTTPWAPPPVPTTPAAPPPSPTTKAPSTTPPPSPTTTPPSSTPPPSPTTTASSSTQSPPPAGT
ncbi:ATP-binding protein [Kitasatospora sp. GAS1066B]|uniref:ATP-binding protein n=1 Tax=Kitasatospora sp. GAS1066B TaxID=3156271 RepID=UPI003514711A